MENLFDYCLESVTCDYVSEGFKDVLKKAGTIASDAAKNAGNAIIKVINTIINTMRKCINTLGNIFRKATGKETKEFQKKDFINYRFKTSTFKKKKSENTAKEKQELENKIEELEDKVKKLKDDLGGEGNSAKMKRDGDKISHEEEIAYYEQEIKRLRHEIISKDNEINSLEVKRYDDRKLMDQVDKDYNDLKNADPKYIEQLIKKYNLQNINKIYNVAGTLSVSIMDLRGAIINFVREPERALKRIRSISSSFDKIDDDSMFNANYKLQLMTVADFRKSVEIFLFEDSSNYDSEFKMFKEKYATIEKYLKEVAALDLSNLDNECKSLVLTSLTRFATLISRISLDVTSGTEKLKSAAFAYAAHVNIRGIKKQHFLWKDN